MISSSLVSFSYSILRDISSLQSIYVSSDNPYYSSVDGLLCLKESSSLIYYPQGKAEVEYSIPISIRFILENSFVNCTYLEIITINSTVESIEEGAISNCSGIHQINYGVETLTDGFIKNSGTSDGYSIRFYNDAYFVSSYSYTNDP